MKTEYTLQHLPNNILVWVDTKVIAQGFTDEESALHAIWVIEGKKQNEFYVVSDGAVEKIERDIL